MSEDPERVLPPQVSSGTLQIPQVMARAIGGQVDGPLVKATVETWVTSLSVVPGLPAEMRVGCRGLQPGRSRNKAARKTKLLAVLDISVSDRAGIRPGGSRQGPLWDKHSLCGLCQGSKTRR